MKNILICRVLFHVRNFAVETEWYVFTDLMVSYIVITTSIFSTLSTFIVFPNFLFHGRYGCLYCNINFTHNLEKSLIHCSWFSNNNVIRGCINDHIVTRIYFITS